MILKERVDILVGGRLLHHVLVDIATDLRGRFSRILSTGAGSPMGKTMHDPFHAGADRDRKNADPGPPSGGQKLGHRIKPAHPTNISPSQEARHGADNA